MWTVGWAYWIGNSWNVQISWGERTWLLLTWMMWVWVPESMLLFLTFYTVTSWMLLSFFFYNSHCPCVLTLLLTAQFVILGLSSCGSPPISWLLHIREIRHLSPEYGSVPHHGPHEDCGGHAVCSARAKKLTTWGQHSSQVRKRDFISMMKMTFFLKCAFVFFLWQLFEEILRSVKVCNIPLLHFFLHLQSFEHDAYCCGTPLWTHGGRVTDQRGTDGATTDDWVGDTEASQDKPLSRAAGEVQELFPNGQQKRRGGTLRCPAAGCRFLRAAQWIFQLAPTVHYIH